MNDEYAYTYTYTYTHCFNSLNGCLVQPLDRLPDWSFGLIIERVVESLPPVTKVRGSNEEITGIVQVRTQEGAVQGLSEECNG